MYLCQKKKLTISPHRILLANEKILIFKPLQQTKLVKDQMLSLKA